jgi:hypothetical protein
MLERLEKLPSLSGRDREEVERLLRLVARVYGDFGLAPVFTSSR